MWTTEASKCPANTTTASISSKEMQQQLHQWRYIICNSNIISTWYHQHHQPCERINTNQANKIISHLLVFTAIKYYYHALANSLVFWANINGKPAQATLWIQSNKASNVA